MAMSRILFKLKQANAPTRIAGFDGQPSWHDLASRITHLFNIPLDRVGVAFVDEAREPVILTGEQGLQDFYKDYQSSGKVKFVVRDLQTPDGASVFS
jgi:Wiskott-Aldrich syndrome protein